MIPMKKIVVQCLNPTFCYLELPGSETSDIHIKQESGLYTQHPNNWIIITGKDAMRKFADVVKNAPIFAELGRDFKVIGPYSESFKIHACKKPVEQCKILSFALENNSGIHINIQDRFDHPGWFFNYDFNVVALPGLTTEESAKKYYQVCQECAKCKTCMTTRQHNGHSNAF